MSKYKKIAFLFPGQGAQYPGMAKDFYETDSGVRAFFEEADDLLGRNLSKIILNGTPEELTKTSNSQPAIYLVSLALLNYLKRQFPDLVPTFCAGLSLGEYSALSAAGSINALDGLQLVEKRGRFMSEACDLNPGTMAAILGLDQESVERLVSKANLPRDLWAANFNAPGQTVISGTHKGIEIGTLLAKENGAKKVIPLAVHGAFHSGLMKPAEDRLNESVKMTSFKNSSIQIVMNASGNFCSDLNTMKELLIKQVVSPVRWQESLKKLDAADLFIEIGCGKTLSALNKRNDVKAPTLSFEKLTDLESLGKELQL